MTIVFRTDSSLQIGSGHVMRCLTLADELRQRGANVMFICREHPANLIGLIQSKGYQVISLKQAENEYVVAPEDVGQAAWLSVSWGQDAADTIAALGDTRPQWLIVDHYAIDRHWEEMLRPRVGKIMVIDDTADRCHDCDLLLDQNLYQNLANRYDGLVPDQCSKLLGPRYALLRREFINARGNLRQRDGSVRRILIFVGGSDPGNETSKALEAIRSLNRPDIALDAVVGGTNPHQEEIKTLCALLQNATYHHQVSNMAELMMLADLAIGAGGSATWERCFVGLPSITLVIAENQAETTEEVAKSGATWCLGYSANVSVERLANAIRLALQRPSDLKEMAEKATQIMGGAMFEGYSQILSAILEEDDAQA
jgi:UDP-2,4-diacetamido-2,4,6-trideoxy-beta-L-altropyranose hydrolase